MKCNKTFYWILLLAVLTVVSSCKYDNNDMINATAGLFNEKVLITTDNIIQTRVSIQENGDSRIIKWQTGDAITLYANNKTYNYHANVQNDGKTVVFTADDGTEKIDNIKGTSVYAFKHNNQVKMSLIQDHFISYDQLGNVPLISKDNARDMFLIASGTIDDGKLNLDFEHIYSYLKVSVPIEDMKDYDFLCVYCYDRNIAPSLFNYDIRNKTFTDETIENGYQYLFVDKKKLDQEGEYYTTYVPVFPSDGTASYYVSGYKEGEKYISKALMFVDDPEGGLSKGQTMKIHTKESFTKSTNFSADGYTTLLESATVGSGIKLVFMGKGFSDKDITSGKYNKVMTREMNRFFEIEPYKSFRKYFTSYCVYRVSETNNLTSVAINDEFDEASEWSTVQKYLGNCINLKEDLFRVILVYNGNYVGRSFTQMNTNGDFVSCIMNNSPCLTAHEAGGHGFCFLADEYVEFDGKPTDDDITDIKEHHDLGLFANVDYKKEQPIWQKFIDNKDYACENIGVYEGANRYSQGMYRPTMNSIMNDHYLSNTFNAPSREAIYKAIMKFSGQEYKEDEFYKYDRINLTSNYNEARQRSAKRGYVKQSIKGLSPIIKENR